MQTFQPSIFARHDTLLGICQALGEDLGISPSYFRVALACGVFFNFGATLAVYLAAGVIVLASRLLYRAPRKLAPEPAIVAVSAPDDEVVAGVRDARTDLELMPLAA